MNCPISLVSLCKLQIWNLGRCLKLSKDFHTYWKKLWNLWVWEPGLKLRHSNHLQHLTSGLCRTAWPKTRGYTFAALRSTKVPFLSPCTIQKYQSVRSCSTKELSFHTALHKSIILSHCNSQKISFCHAAPYKSIILSHCTVTLHSTKV